VHAQLRLARQRHGGPPDERNVPEGGGHQVRSTSPYKGAAQALTDVISGTVELYMSSVPTLHRPDPQRQAACAGGHLGQARGRPARRRPPSTSRATRASTPSPGSACWPRPARPRTWSKRLNAEFNKALQQPDLRKKLGDEGADPPAARPSSSPTLIRDDIVRWGKVVKESGARID
jgi:hypothetical protein